MLVHDRQVARGVARLRDDFAGIFGSALALFLHEALALGPEFDTAFAV